MPWKNKKIYLIYTSLLLTLMLFILYVLPVILVAIHLGKILANITLHNQWLIILANFKFFLFIVSGLLLLLTDWLLRKDTKFFIDMPQAQRRYQYILNISLLFWLISFILGYLLTLILIFLETV